MTERERQLFRATYKTTLLALIDAAKSTGIPARVLAEQFLDDPRVLAEILARVEAVMKGEGDGGERT